MKVFNDYEVYISDEEKLNKFECLYSDLVITKRINRGEIKFVNPFTVYEYEEPLKIGRGYFKYKVTFRMYSEDYHKYVEKIIKIKKLCKCVI